MDVDVEGGKRGGRGGGGRREGKKREREGGRGRGGKREGKVREREGGRKGLERLWKKMTCLRILRGGQA